MAGMADRVFAKEVSVVGALYRAGVRIVAGTDQAVPGHSLHREIELYVEAGLTPMEAIQAATIVPARVMGLDRELGTIEAGKRADMILLDGNPLDNIHSIRKVEYVVANGKMYQCAQLWTSVGFKP
jgi:imidazolonepropionase-like amidohydrolase